jgi:CRP/FNR family transcriptional regulator, anaerobic regulatory protein
MNYSLSTHEAAKSYLPISVFSASVAALGDARLEAQAPGLPTSASALRPLSELLKLMAGSQSAPDACTGADASPASLLLQVAVRQVRAGTALFLEGTRATHLYVVRVGTFKTIKTAEDGYEQVLAFAGMGEVMGFEALCENRQPVAAMALEDSSVYAVPLHDLSSLRQQSPALDRALQTALSRQLMRVSEMTELMAAVSSEARLARFIAWWAARMAAHGQSSRRLLLRMSRRDIASLLGIAHETVSRSFSAFVERGLLRVDNREIEVLDPEGLKARARNTRGLADPSPARKSATVGCSGPIVLTQKEAIKLALPA